ncbi:MAG: hypothetical protein ACE5FM_06630, partial [Methyloligellaceae bacterium]
MLAAVSRRQTIGPGGIQMGVEILPPDVNESMAPFIVVDQKIRYGLGAIKNVGLGAIESIVNARE